MKKKMFLTLFSAFIILLSSCKKEKPTSPPPCTIKCQNGGTVAANCDCKCPSGYTGSNCQTRIFINDIANLNSNTYHQLCPVWYSGDDDFGGWLTIDWNVKLTITNNNTRVYANVYAHYKEYSSTGNTRAKIDPALASSQILLYTAPAGKKIYSINSEYNYGGTIAPPGNYHGMINYLTSDATSFLNKMELIGDTSGPDLACDGSTERSRFRIYFKSFGVTLVYQ